MPSSIYVGTNASATGKRMVTLGVMELAARRFGRVAFFRPVVRVDAASDASLRMMRCRYHLAADPDTMCGVTRAEARELLAEDRYTELIQRVQQRFKSLEAESDFVVVEGTSFQGLAPELEFELNADLAVNLGCQVLMVYGMGSQPAEECVRSVRIGNESFEDHGARIVATVINQVPDSGTRSIREGCAAAGLERHGPIYFLPETPLLRQPTIRELQVGVGAELYAGDEAMLDREITTRKVAAMQLPTFLDRMSAGGLVITPGDRSDILGGCVLAASRQASEAPAAVLLTGEIVPPESIKRLIGPTTPLPILTTRDDTYVTASKAAEVRAQIGEHAPLKIESALGVFERHVDVDDLADRLKTAAPTTMTPMLFEHSLIQRARQRRVRIVLPEGTEPRVLRAVDILRRRDVADLVLLGDPQEVRAAATQAGVTLPEQGVEIIDPKKSSLTEGFAEAYWELRKHKGVTLDAAHDRLQEVNYFGTMMVHRGLAGGLVSGAVHTTAHTIRPSFEFIKTRPGVDLVSSVFLMCLKDGVLVYGDCAVVPNPTDVQLVEIASSSADTAAQFGIEPRVAMLSYSTGDSGQGEDVDKVRHATTMLRERRPDLLVEGPLQYDAAVDPGVAATKLPDSQVAGRATVLIFPDLNTGNNLYKAVQRSANAVAIGPILQGLNKPVNDLSRGCTVADIVNTVAITAIQA
ncbi:MAG: phosphate acetyltransferase [Planctomycetota bacterium]